MKMDTQTSCPTIIIVSGGVGAVGEQLVHTILPQFPGKTVNVVTVPNVRFNSQIDEALAQARSTQATVVHTLVDPRLRHFLIDKAAEQQVAAIDLMGELLDRLEVALEQEPLGQPGLYRKLNKDYFDRVGAIEFTMAHDDGRHADTWNEADMLLVGVSRVGKTPLSLYLSVLGWKVANQPLVSGLELPAELRVIDRQRVVGLTIEAGQLLALRQQRQRRLGAPGASDYVKPQRIFDELAEAKQIFKRLGLTVIDVTDKPIESTADELIRLITSRFKGHEQPG
jgi:[pyruvate, water dikinase]-phosphate phosphotransferase / [pyruvate, water dikinase] kinase